MSDKARRLLGETAMNCDRCGQRPGEEAINVGSQGVTLCKRCADVFWRRFRRFMLGE